MATLESLPKELIFAIREAIWEVKDSPDDTCKTTAALCRTSKTLYQKASEYLYRAAGFFDYSETSNKPWQEYKHLLPFAYQILTQDDIGPMVRSFGFELRAPAQSFGIRTLDDTSNNDSFEMRPWLTQEQFAGALKRALARVEVVSPIKDTWCFLASSGDSPEPVFALILLFMPRLTTLDIAIDKTATLLPYIFETFELAALRSTDLDKFVPFQHLTALVLIMHSDEPVRANLWDIRHVFAIPSLRRLVLIGWKEARKPKYRLWAAAQENIIPRFHWCITELKLLFVRFDARTFHFLINNMKMLTSLALAPFYPLCNVPMPNPRPDLTPVEYERDDAHQSIGLNGLLKKHRDSLESLKLRYSSIWGKFGLLPDSLDALPLQNLKRLRVDPIFLAGHPLIGNANALSNAAHVRYDSFVLSDRIPTSMQQLDIVHDTAGAWCNDWGLLENYLANFLRAVEDLVTRKDKEFRNFKRLGLPKYRNSSVIEGQSSRIIQIAEEKGLEIIEREPEDVIILDPVTGLPASPPEAVTRER
ncbi:MAG: hypothetical protein M1831_004894 [Alyxoria varia]|nr:MAG: hypothetical protein M1831_004894 [Alyxoria varia]